MERAGQRVREKPEENESHGMINNRKCKEIKEYDNEWEKMDDSEKRKLSGTGNENLLKRSQKRINRESKKMNKQEKEALKQTKTVINHFKTMN